MNFYKAQGWSWDQRNMVQNICEGIPEAKVKKCGEEGVKNLLAAKPIEPNSNEVPSGMRIPYNPDEQVELLESGEDTPPDSDRDENE